MDRRSFLNAGALSTMAIAGLAAGISPAWAAAQEPANIRNYNPNMRYRPHGLTGASVSALGFGMLRLPMLADGKTVDEAMAELDKYLDDAYIAHVPSVRIVHGKGTGALRNAVQQHLKRCKYVKTYRLGTLGEGDAGVTIAEFK